MKRLQFITAIHFTIMYIECVGKFWFGPCAYYYAILVINCVAWFVLLRCDALSWCLLGAASLQLTNHRIVKVCTHCTLQSFALVPTLKLAMSAAFEVDST